MDCIFIIARFHTYPTTSKNLILYWGNYLIRLAAIHVSILLIANQIAYLCNIEEEDVEED